MSSSAWHCVQLEELVHSILAQWLRGARGFTIKASRAGPCASSEAEVKQCGGAALSRLHCVELQRAGLARKMLGATACFGKLCIIGVLRLLAVCGVSFPRYSFHGVSGPFSNKRQRCGSERKLGMFERNCRKEEDGGVGDKAPRHRCLATVGRVRSELPGLGSTA